MKKSPQFCWVLKLRVGSFLKSGSKPFGKSISLWNFVFIFSDLHVRIFPVASLGILLFFSFLSRSLFEFTRLDCFLFWFLPVPPPNFCPDPVWRAVVSWPLALWFSYKYDENISLCFLHHYSWFAPSCKISEFDSWSLTYSYFSALGCSIVLSQQVTSSIYVQRALQYNDFAQRLGASRSCLYWIIFSFHSFNSLL